MAERPLPAAPVLQLAGGLLILIGIAFVRSEKKEVDLLTPTGPITLERAA